MKKIALTGNIASGKSMVQNIIADLGFKVIDADEVCHDLLQNNSDVITAVKSAFQGYEVVDQNGEIDRIKLGKIVFSSQSYKKSLEDILHPEVEKKIQEFFIKNNNEDMAFAAVPLLFEANMQAGFDKIVFVSTDEKIRLSRLMNRNNFSENDAIARINAQDNENDKIAKSDFVIFNNGSIDELILNTQALISKLKLL